ncbi:hypothetical protein XELAEV_18001588mg [Xenopus laevis]|nr:hypothetical protein XELAEV_18001588mg [Xenopus laevis]
MLVRSDLGGKQIRQSVLRPKNNGTFPCLSCNCCSNCQKGDTVYHPRKGNPIKIRGYYTCTSTFVVYIVKCPCGYLYVGQTTRMIRERIREHTSAIRLKKTDQAVASHFVEKGHGVQQLKFQVLDNVPKL